MNYRTLGRTGMQVSPFCLGAMMFGRFGNRDHDDSVRIIHRALDAGINFIDTADVYSAGESEEIVAKALAGGRRDNVILATKGHFPVEQGPFDPNPPANKHGNSRRWITKACDDSLRRLGTDWIDLYQIHRPDPTADIDETLGVLSDLVHQGKIRAFGSSTFPAELIVEAQWVAERRGRERFQCEQPPYSIFVRWIERDVLPTVAQFGMGAIVWSPLNGGWLSGMYRKETGPRTEGRAARMAGRFDFNDPYNQRKLDLVEELIRLADECGISLVHLALAFSLEHPAVTSTIIGPRTMEHLESQLGADEHRLPSEILDAIDKLVEPGTNVSPTESIWSASLGRSSRRRAR
jgi:aryl-alcohol dehydrogenase-like predicted oxidoreductase